tara:strand:+ start:2596 stop:3810 length:1215 start_codon:yes stop_codon:yes gene_type:complete
MYDVYMTHPASKEKLNGTVTVWSNSYGTPTGYGVQTEYLIDRLVKHGANTAMLSNFGHQGQITKLETAHGKIDHFPMGASPYSQDVAPLDHMTFAARYPQKDLLVTLYDVHVLKSPYYDKIDKIASWTPLDHVTMPKNVEAWLHRSNVTPIAMSPFGKREMDARGIENVYIPHGIDTKVMKPTELLPSGQNVREYMKTEDKFVVGMVAANKATGMVHRKAFSENILAFSLFNKKHPDSVLYIHTDPLGSMGGWNLLELVRGCGISEDSVIFPNSQEYRYGIPQVQLAALYTGMDVLLATSYGEGFGVPTIEAQSCGTKVIGSGWAATQDLVADDGWLVDGQPDWDAGQHAWWQKPSVPSIVNALELAYNSNRGTSELARKFAKQFDVDKVWYESWLPFLKGQLR